ncbi:MAG: hypothetical protein ABSF03_21685 [Streptosporangiaceae bacterium]
MKAHTQVLVALPGASPAGTLQWQLSCPVCGEDAVDRVGWTQGSGDHEAVTMQPDRDDYGSPIGTRGGYLRVDLECVVGHGFALIVANHKGAEFVGVVPAGA